MWPVSAEFEINQPFGSYATGGVSPNEFGTEVQQLVYQYGTISRTGMQAVTLPAPWGHRFTPSRRARCCGLTGAPTCQGMKVTGVTGNAGTCTRPSPAS